MYIIDGLGGAFFCGSGFGTVACIAGGASIAVSNIGGDVEEHCDSGTIITDTVTGIFGTVLGPITQIGVGALDSAPGWQKLIFNTTTNAPSGVQGAGQVLASPTCGC